MSTAIYRIILSAKRTLYCNLVTEVLDERMMRSLFEVCRVSVVCQKVRLLNQYQEPYVSPF